MIRSTLFCFLTGWLLWFWIDKNPYTLGPLPPPMDGEYVKNFQLGVDLAREGRFKAAFVYLWKAHYLILSVGIGLLLWGLADGVAGALRRKRLRRLYIPDKPASRREDKAADVQPGKPGDSDQDSSAP